MRLFSISGLFVVLAGVANVKAHYIFSNVTTPSPPINHGNFTAIRFPSLQPELPFHSVPSIFDPIMDTADPNIRCNQFPNSTDQVISVNAGDVLTLDVWCGFDDAITVYGLYHPGVLMVYMAKMPDGVDGGVANWDGSGKVWFKIHEIGPLPESAGRAEATFPTTGMTSIEVTIPPSVPAGEYLLRPEHLALHNMAYDLDTRLHYPNPQFFMVCAQLSVSSNGNGVPSPLVEFPGAYQMTDPGIAAAGFTGWNWTEGTPINYTMPGPPVWVG